MPGRGKHATKSSRGRSSVVTSRERPVPSSARTGGTSSTSRGRSSTMASRRDSTSRRTQRQADARRSPDPPRDQERRAVSSTSQAAERRQVDRRSKAPPTGDVMQSVPGSLNAELATAISHLTSIQAGLASCSPSPQLISEFPASPVAVAARPSDAISGSIQDVFNVGVGKSLPGELSDISVPLWSLLDESLRTKIMNREFVDLARLLPGNRDKQQHRFLRVSTADRSSGKNPELSFEDAPAPRIYSLTAWQSAFRVYESVYIRAHPQEAVALCDYEELICNIERQGGDWNFYDVSFRKLRALRPSLSWDIIQPQIYLQASTRMWASAKGYRTPFRQSVGQQGAGRSGYCFKYNGQGKSCQESSATCRYQHACSKCKGYHPAYKCTNKSISTSSTPGESGFRSGPVGKQPSQTFVKNSNSNPGRRA